jgi:CheY-like chemotaxis protein/anti-sigma regulatory factor (Ser/Thr protein kinase)
MARKRIRQALDRGAKLTQQLLTFARRSPLNPEVIDLGRRVTDLRDLLDRSLREDISVVIDMPAGLWLVEADASQLEVAVLNISVNARDAMPNGGLIRIAALNVRGETPAEDQVHLSVSDTGTGMGPELVDKVFEPFFTTKGVGQGTGLGLSQVYGFARAAGGTVQIDSEEGRGTTVTIALPRSHAILAPSDAPIEIACEDTPERCRVLVAEDDAQVADLLVQMLEELGYEPTRVSSADAALAAIDRGFPADIILSDMVMPGEMGGLDLARAIRQRRPETPVLLMTGYSDAALAAGREQIELLNKPFTFEQLRGALAKVTGVEAAGED